MWSGGNTGEHKGRGLVNGGVARGWAGRTRTFIAKAGYGALGCGLGNLEGQNLGRGHTLVGGALAREAKLEGNRI